ncbi:MAG: hypothetical protein WC291_09520 [Thermodesulfovibrionales bacterium]|jgi:hypothetical protein
MSKEKTLTELAILYELSDRDFRRKLALFPEELRYYVVLANSIIGAENSKRVRETPAAVAEDSEGFVSQLLKVMPPGQDETFRAVLERCLAETLKDELRFNCPNCCAFARCLDMADLNVGRLFSRRVNGEETEDLKAEIRAEIELALERTPYLNTDEADLLCSDFSHSYSSASAGEVFGRYAEIAASLHHDFGIDYRSFQQQMLSLNMEFHEKSTRAAH